LVQDEIEKILENKHFIEKTKKGKRKPREGYIKDITPDNNKKHS
jgi:hypothetical protein